MQFWKGYDLHKRYNGKVKGVLSVDVSDWTSTEYKGKIAECCDPTEVAELVWEQIEKSLNVAGKKVVDKSMIEFHYVGRDIKWQKNIQEDVDTEPLLVNKVETLSFCSRSKQPESAVKTSTIVNSRSMRDPSLSDSESIRADSCIE